MTRAWLQKELRDHGIALIAWFILAAALFGMVMTLIAMEEASGSWFDGTQRFTNGWCLFGVTYLAGRLIRREYASRTQLFLESLPISRARVLTTKLILGAVLLALVMLLAIALSAYLASRAQGVQPRLLLFIAARTITTVWFAWALLAMAALLGRYRTPLLVVLVLAIYALAELTELELSNLGPARLLGSELPFEATHFPWTAFAQTWIAIAVCVGTSYALLLARDGALTVLLSDRMSHREKVYVTCVLLAFMVGISTLGQSKKPAPYRLEDATVFERNGTRVELSAEVHPELAEQLGPALLEAIEAARTYVGLESVPSLSLIPTQELDPSETQRAFVANASGLVLRAALYDEKLDRSRLTTVAIHDLVSDAHEDRAMAEALHWMLDGYANLEGERQTRGEAYRALLWLRAASIAPQRLEPFLNRWDVAQEQLGPCVAGAAAASVLLTVEALAGAEAMQRLVRRMLHTQAQRSWYAADTRLATIVSEETGLDLGRLEAEWRSRLDRVRVEGADALGPLAATRTELKVERLSGKTFELRHRVVISPPPEGPVRYSLRYEELGPIDTPEDETGFELQQALVNADAPVSMPRPLIEGSRWMWVIDVPSEPLACPVRVLAERREIR